MVSNKDINWIHDMIQERYEDAKGVEKSILGEVLGLFEAAPEFQIVMTLNDATDEEIRNLLAGMRHECIIMPGGTELSMELVEPEQKWIPVSERLPDKELWEYQKKYNQDNMEVLVMIKGAKEPTTLYYGDDGDFNDDEGNSWLVTHWMPLPEPPKDVTDINVGNKKEG